MRSFLEFGAKSGKKIHQNFSEKMQNSTKKFKKSEIQLFNREKKLAIFDEKIEIRERCKTVQRSALCRSRRELSNEYLLAKIGVDTAENEPLEVRGGNIQYYSIVSLLASRPGGRSLR